jgi:hypothetical protein
MINGGINNSSVTNTTSNNNQLVLASNSQNQFVENVKKWVLYDQQLKLIKEKSDKIRDMKHVLGSAICTYMDENNLSQNEIEITNGKLKVYEKKEYSPLTFSYIEQSLAKIITDKSHIQFIIQYLKENREIKTSTDLKSIYKK